ncbi:hypothetical protein GCM10010174_84050 [Kutzneria viridogrisea]|uniref:Major facilitator superfamily (MFS) profile domain-containing protein n=2 Tax=Kutzneria TaxID=43356 RepID=W5WI84_9PSEU|nr:MFS transporter [Kutzneria albida]AHI00297.1 hypothetical protein KALB_6938 [Kutzneria albida DSM 43870]MBA8925475.1 MFS family permease [Kutzneria viridogrisea]
MAHKGKPGLVLTAVLLSSVMFPLTIAGASVALTGIRADLGAELAATQWVVNGYNACFAAFLVFTGSLADVVGKRRIYACGLALFCLCGAVSAFAGDILLLDLVRALGGIGAAAAVTGGTSMLAATFDGPARARVFGLFGTALGIGLAFGPTIGGLLVDGLGWRAVFGVPAAFALVALLLVPALPVVPVEPGRRVDWAGAALFTTSLLLLIFALVQGADLGFTSPVILGSFAAVLLLGFAFTRVERRKPDPLFDLGLLANRRFLALSAAAGAIVIVLVPLMVYLPSYLIEVVHLSAGQTGIWLLMLTGPSVVLPTLGGLLATRVPPIALVVGSVAITGIGALLLVTIGPDSTPLALLVPFLLTGAGLGLSIGLNDGLAIGSVPPEKSGTASGMFNTARLANETVAIALVGAVLAGLSGGALTGTGYTSALRTVCVGLGVFALLATGAVAWLSRRDRAA